MARLRVILSITDTRQSVEMAGRLRGRRLTATAPCSDGIDTKGSLLHAPQLSHTGLVWIGISAPFLTFFQ